MLHISNSLFSRIKEPLPKSMLRPKMAQENDGGEIK
jgi:hypothetical protein